MQAYKLDTTISEDGIISLPSMPGLFNKEVKLTIVPKEKEPHDKEKYSALDFLEEWSGAFKINEEDLNQAKYEYLTDKYR
jgi:hypothetical protein